jgi:zinc D-Ala-D-Ala carboxypeptidase
MINLEDKIPGAESFKYKEFTRSTFAIRKGINNIPNAKQWYNIEKLAVNILQPVRNQFGMIKITSGFRTIELNKLIGGSPTSNHCRGEAADIEPLVPGLHLLDLVEFIYNYLEFRTIILEYPKENGWVHVDYREGGNLKNLKLKDYHHDYEDVALSDLLKLGGLN